MSTKEDMIAEEECINECIANQMMCKRCKSVSLMRRQCQCDKPIPSETLAGFNYTCLTCKRNICWCTAIPSRFSRFNR